MFGIKIIKEKEYNKLLSIKKDAYEEIRRVIDGRKKIESDCESLREQLNESIMKQKNLDLNHLHVLKTESYPCDKCKCESDNCIKITFANQTICAIDKKYVNDFTKKTTKKIKK